MSEITIIKTSMKKIDRILSGLVHKNSANCEREKKTIAGKHPRQEKNPSFLDHFSSQSQRINCE